MQSNSAPCLGSKIYNNLGLILLKQRSDKPLVCDTSFYKGKCRIASQSLQTEIL